MRLQEDVRMNNGNNENFICGKLNGKIKGRNKSLSGSMTVEASLILPIFLFFILSVLSFLNILQIQSRIFISLKEIGKEMCVYGYIYQGEENGDSHSTLLGDIAFSEVYVKNKLISRIGKTVLQDSPIIGGSSGITCATSQMMRDEKDRIDLRAVYYVEPEFSFLFSKKYLVCTRFAGRAWTGYDVTNHNQIEDDDVYVYITETGKVYHTSLKCPSLNLQIQTVFYKQISNKRNENGGKYYACERCAKGKAPWIVYITTDGDKYHFNRECSGLKRTIFTVPLSTVGDRGRCRRCP